LASQLFIVGCYKINKKGGPRRRQAKEATVLSANVSGTNKSFSVFFFSFLILFLRSLKSSKFYTHHLAGEEKKIL
jgi:hypothetical protein